MNDQKLAAILYNFLPVNRYVEIGALRDSSAVLRRGRSGLQLSILRNRRSLMKYHLPAARIKLPYRASQRVKALLRAWVRGNAPVRNQHYGF